MTNMDGRGSEDPDRPLKDVQEMTGTDLAVYEAAAALDVAERPATAAEITRLTGLPEETVRHCLDTLVAGGRLVPSGEDYRLGPHDFSVER